MRSIKHERFDLAFFSSLFSLHELREQARTRPFLVPSGQIITSPFHLTTIELVRREVLGGTLPTGAVPVDVFVFGAGDPPAPHLTKIGGSPFRSRRKPWPTRRDGHPLGFVGQLSFVDSGDIVSELPGDVLLVFVDPDALLSSDSYVLEWVKIDETELITASEIPEVRYTWNPGVMARKRGAVPEERRFELFACYGVVHRTFDIPSSDAIFSAYASPQRVGVLEATKIGGVARTVQAPLRLAGSFLASVASINPAPEVPYPWTNWPEPISMSSRHRIPTWRLGDSGSLYLCEDGGHVSIEAQGY